MQFMGAILSNNADTVKEWTEVWELYAFKFIIKQLYPVTIDFTPPLVVGISAACMQCCTAKMGLWSAM